MKRIVVKRGTVFGFLTAVCEGAPRNGRTIRVRCICGEVREVSLNLLRKGATRSCGCLRRKVAYLKRGQRFGRWQVLGYVEQRHVGKKRVPKDVVRVRCECGASKEVLVESLKKGLSVSCGCLRSEQLSARLRASKGTKIGPMHATWKGGRRVDARGYVEIWIAPDDPLIAMARSKTSSGGGYAFEHRIVVARRLGRPLRRSEHVHHVDGDRQNNAGANLQLMQKAHPTGVVRRCRACGSHDVEVVRA